MGLRIQKVLYACCLFFIFITIEHFDKSLNPWLRKYNLCFQAEVSEWVSSKHNMGMAFTKTEWKKIVGCSSDFCKVCFYLKFYYIIIFVTFSMMTITGTGHCNTSPSTA